MSNVYYWPFEFGKKTRANEMLQKVLADYGYYKHEVDGIFGTETKKSLEYVQAKYNIPVTGVVDRATEDLLFPGNYERRTPSMKLTSTWLSGIVASTGFKYLLTILSSWVAAKFGLDGDVVLALLTQAFGLAMGIWGMIEAAKSKIVANGNVVNLSNAPEAQQIKAAQVVAEMKGVPVSSITK